jgi:hypothetical protein
VVKSPARRLLFKKCTLAASSGLIDDPISSILPQRLQLLSRCHPDTDNLISSSAMTTAPFPCDPLDSFSHEAT